MVVGRVSKYAQAEALRYHSSALARGAGTMGTVSERAPHFFEWRTLRAGGAQMAELARIQVTLHNFIDLWLPIGWVTQCIT